jgi:arabinofuranosyltransferase
MPEAQRPPSSERTGYELDRRIPHALVGLGCILAAASIWMSFDAIVDDALISLRYARNFLDGLGLVFNPGEYVEGYTNLGHVLGVIALGSLGVDLITAARLIGVAGGIAAVVYGPAALLPEREQSLERAVARLLLLSNFYFVYLSFGGLETGLYTGFLCATVYAFKKDADRVGWLVGGMAGLLFVIRPDGILYGATLIALAALRHGVLRVARMPGPWVWVGMAIALETWRFAYYGELVPNTARVKGAAGYMGLRNFPWYGLVGDDVVELLAQSGGVACVLFALLAVVRYPRRDRVVAALAIGAATFFFAVYAGGDWMFGYRFFIPFLPFYLTLVAIGMVEVLRALQGRGRDLPVQIAFVGALVIIAVDCVSVGIEFHFKGAEYPNTHMTSRYMIPAAKWIGAHYPSSYQITAATTGSLGYYSNLVVIDTIGLTDAVIPRARRDRAREAAYIESRDPELVLLNAYGDPKAELEIYGRRYRFERSFKRGVNPRWLLYARADLPQRPIDGGEIPGEPDVDSETP